MTEAFSDDLISSYLDGELSATERERVRAQLAAHPDQEKLLADFQAMGNLLRELPSESAPPQLLASIKREISTSNGQSPDPDGQAGTKSATVRPERISRARHYDRLRVASAAVVGLLSIVGIAYVGLNQPSGPAGQTDNLIVAQAAPKSGTVEMATAMELADSAEGMVANNRANGDGLSRRSVGGVESLIVKPSMMGVDATSEDLASKMELPPSPPLAYAMQAAELDKLAKSPKLRGELQPGELVEYITYSDDEVTVIELSVVDVARAFGQIQVLLASNAIEPIERKAVSQPGGTQQEIDEPTANSEPSDQPVADAELADGLPGEVNANDDGSGLVAFYVEASNVQFVETLNDLEALDAVKLVHLGDSPGMAERLYSVTPVDNQLMLSSLAENTSAPSGDAASADSFGARPEPADAAVANSRMPFLIERELARKGRPRFRSGSPQLGEYQNGQRFSFSQEMATEANSYAAEPQLRANSVTAPERDGQVPEQVRQQQMMDNTILERQRPDRIEPFEQSTVPQLSYQIPVRVRPVAPALDTDAKPAKAKMVGENSPQVQKPADEKRIPESSTASQVDAPNGSTPSQITTPRMRLLIVLSAVDDAPTPPQPTRPE